MATDRYDLPTVGWDVQGWDAVMAAAMEIIDDIVPAREIVTLGETVVVYEALYQASTGKWSKAKADGSLQPCQGIAIEGGILDGLIRVQRMGFIENVSWAWATLGAPIYLSDSVAGGLTQTKPATNAEIVGYAFSATKMLIVLGGVVNLNFKILSRGGTILSPTGAVNVIVWRAPFVCTVLAVKGYRVGGTGVTINARKNGASNHLASDLSLTSPDTWMDGGAVQNTAYVVGDKLEIMVVTVAGSPTQVAVQVDLTL